MIHVTLACHCGSDRTARFLGERLYIHYGYNRDGFNRIMTVLLSWLYTLVTDFARALLTTVKVANSVAGSLACNFAVAFVNPPNGWLRRCGGRRPRRRRQVQPIRRQAAAVPRGLRRRRPHALHAGDRPRLCAHAPARGHDGRGQRD